MSYHTTINHHRSHGPAHSRGNGPHASPHGPPHGRPAGPPHGHPHGGPRNRSHGPPHGFPHTHHRGGPPHAHHGAPSSFEGPQGHVHGRHGGPPGHMAGRKCGLGRMSSMCKPARGGDDMVGKILAIQFGEGSPMAEKLIGRIISESNKRESDSKEQSLTDEELHQFLTERFPNYSRMVDAMLARKAAEHGVHVTCPSTKADSKASCKEAKGHDINIARRGPPHGFRHPQRRQFLPMMAARGPRCHRHVAEAPKTGSTKQDTEQATTTPLTAAQLHDELSARFGGDEEKVQRVMRVVCPPAASAVTAVDDKEARRKAKLTDQLNRLEKKEAHIRAQLANLSC